TESNNEVKIFPYSCNEQETLLHELNISNHPDVHTFNDYWGNKVGLFNILPPHKELTIESKLIIRTTASSQLKINFHSSWDDLQNEVSNNL
ncbi:transglutaminase N-terminal domain-containing protein, partial [Salmonella enterica]|uniref:transglutaminase N-terminal domain-containing protein n=1 Tax=Salmonella enterica TaxID=28901 RepID=UPI0032B35C12